MSEKWTFTVIATEPGGDPTELRVSLEDREINKEATIQITVAGEQVDVDDKPRDYEAPEWKAKHILQEGGVSDVEGYVAALKAHLREALSAAST